MSSTERIPRAMAEKFAAITALTDAFCEKRLNDEYRVLIRRVVANLASYPRIEAGRTEHFDELFLPPPSRTETSGNGLSLTVRRFDE